MCAKPHSDPELNRKSTSIQNSLNFNKNKIHSDSEVSNSSKSFQKLLKYTKRGYSGLPQNVLINIFEYFDEKELQNNIIPVCQQWKYAAESPLLWKSITFSGAQVDSSTICQKIWQYNNLEKICLKNITNGATIIRQICRCTDNLTCLVLRYCSKITEDSLRYLLRTCRNLQTLDLKGTSFRSMIFHDELTCAPNLTSLNLSESKYTTRKNILTVAVNCRKLEEFHLSTFNSNDKVYLDDSDCYFIIRSMLHDLKGFSLDCSTLNSCAFLFILRCKHLRYLCLNYAYNFPGPDFQKIWEHLHHLTTLKVRFAHQVVDGNVQRLFEDGKQVMGNLEVIDFTGCSRISNAGILAIANCCPKLKSLILRGCKKIKSMTPVFQKCRDLEMLNIAFCESLSTEDLLPIPDNLKILFISNDNKFKSFGDFVKRNRDKVTVKICVSEFNKNTINY